MSDTNVAVLANSYCTRLGIAVPHTVDLVARGTTKLFHLLVATLLERGGPMTLDEIAERLEEAGVVTETGDVAHSLQKAWHGLAPVYRDAAGRFGLDLDALELRIILRTVGLLDVAVRSPAPPPTLSVPGDDIPLSADEVDAAFRNRSIWSLSWTRQAAAVLDARRVPMTPGEIEEVLAALTHHRAKLSGNRPPKGELLLCAADGPITLSSNAVGVAAMRRAIRKLSQPVLVQRARSAAQATLIAASTKKREDQERQYAARARALRRAIVHVVPSETDPRAAALLDVGARSIGTFLGEQMSRLRRCIETFDVVVGLHVRDTLHALGLDGDRFRLVDLAPPKKSRRINRAGRTLTITPELLIAGTTGISRPLGDPTRIARYLRDGDDQKLGRRLESDVKALFAFYQHGVLHRGVRLRWGFLDEGIGTDWALPGDPGLYEQLKGASETGAMVDLVLGAAPGWTDPWSRAKRVRVLEVGYHSVVVAHEGVRFSIDRGEIQAVRVAPPP